MRACTVIDPAALAAPRNAAFFGSIIATLDHNFIIDLFYVSGMEGTPIGPSGYAVDVPHPDLFGLTTAQRGIDRRFVTMTEDPTLADPAREVILPRGDITQVERFDRIFLHLIQHQIHHRGQVHALLTEAGVPPPQLDKFRPAWAQDRNRRAPDFVEMGLTEAQVWPSVD